MVTLSSACADARHAPNKEAVPKALRMVLVEMD